MRRIADDAIDDRDQSVQAFVSVPESFVRTFLCCCHFRDLNCRAIQPVGKHHLRGEELLVFPREIHVRAYQHLHHALNAIEA